MPRTRAFSFDGRGVAVHKGIIETLSKGKRWARGRGHAQGVTLAIDHVRDIFPELEGELKREKVPQSI